LNAKLSIPIHELRRKDAVGLKLLLDV